MQQKKILVVDDSKSMRAMVKSQLKLLGYENISEAENGDHAIQILTNDQMSTSPFDVVISDWKMPYINGLQLLNFIRKSLSGPQPKVLMITAEGEKKDMLDALKSGANGYLLKPFNDKELSAALIKVIGKPKPNAT